MKTTILRLRKIWGISISLLIITTPASTYGLQLYVGASLDPNRFSATQTFKFDPNKVNHVNQYDNQRSWQSLVINASIEAGLQLQNDSFIFDGAIRGNGLHQQITTSNNDFQSSLTQNNNIEILAKIGKEIANNYIVCVLAGYSWSNDKYNVNFNPGGIYDSNTMLLENISNNLIFRGPEIGVGLTRHISGNIDFFIDFTHTFYQTEKVDLNHRKITFNNPKGVIDIQPAMDAIHAGATYYFNP